VTTRTTNVVDAPRDLRLPADPALPVEELHRALVAAVAGALGARAVALHLDDPVTGRPAPVVAHGAHPAPAEHVVALAAADGAPLGRLTASGGDGPSLGLWGARVERALEAHAEASEREREASALTRLAALAPVAGRGADDALLAACAAVRDVLGFAAVEAAVLREGRLHGIAAAGGTALLPGLGEEEALALLGAAPPSDGCHLLPAGAAPATWPAAPPAGAGPAAFRAHGVLAPLRDRSGAVIGLLRAAAPAGGRHPSRGRLRLLAAFAAQAGAALAEQGAVRREQRRAGAVLDGALDAVLTVDAGGRLLALNPAGERVLGLRRAEALGADVAELLVPAPQRTAFRAALAEGGHRLVQGRQDVLVRRGDGREVPVALSVVSTHVDGAPAFTAFLRVRAAPAVPGEEADRIRPTAARTPSPGCRAAAAPRRGCARSPSGRTRRRRSARCTSSSGTSGR